MIAGNSPRTILHASLPWMALLGVLASVPPSMATAESVSDETEKECGQVLIDSLSAQGEWTSVHAAEFLIRLDQPEKTLTTFRLQAENAEPPFRIGVWRVLAQAEPTPEARKAYVERIRAVLMNTEANDRLHALESLAKLVVPIQSGEELDVVKQMSSPEHPACSFALWRLYQHTPSPEIVTAIAGQLSSTDPIARLRAGFVLGQLDTLPESIQNKVAKAIESEPHDSIAFPYVASAGGVSELRKLSQSSNPTHQALALKELAVRSQTIDFSNQQALDPKNPLSLRQAAAFAWLTQHTTPSPMP